MFQKFINFTVLLFLGFAIGYVYQNWQKKLNFKEDIKPHEKHFMRFSEDLNLNKKQKKEIRNILDQQRDKLDALHEKIKPEFKKIHEDTKISIRKLLNDNQKNKFDENSSKFREKGFNPRDHKGPPPHHMKGDRENMRKRPPPPPHHSF